MNEERGIASFETIRGWSWIDLTLYNNILAQKLRGWTCGEYESCSDHNLIRFDIETDNDLQRSRSLMEKISH
jgi:hypothetical protein